MSPSTRKVALLIVLSVSLIAAGPRGVRSAESDAGKSPQAAARPAPKIYEHVHSTDGSVLVYVRGGTFTMGAEDDDEDARPPHPITVKGYWLGKYEVTNAQYARFLKSASADGTRYQPSYWEEPGYDDPQQPVVGATWLSAMAYCKWAGVRLPTEAEWEYAAAAGAKQLKYPTATGQIDHDLGNFQGKGGRDQWDGPAPVGKFAPNPFGLYDMAGNAWEWTASLYRPYPFTTQGTPGQDARVLRVMRGGCWHYPAEICRTAHRHRFADHLTLDYAGFRIAMDAAAK